MKDCTGHELHKGDEVMTWDGDLGLIIKIDGPKVIVQSLDYPEQEPLAWYPEHITKQLSYDET